MARRGRCRCGSVLHFDQGPDGYKTRCPRCGSMVRLRAASPRAVAKRRMVACPCGAAIPVRSGTIRTTCPGCQRKLVLVRKKSLPRDASARPMQAGNWPRALTSAAAAEFCDGLPAAQPGPSLGRTVTCEACHRIVSAEALHCPGCGSILALTTAAPILDSEEPSVRAAVPKALPYRLILGLLAVGAALMLMVAIVLIVSLRL